jgi:hypothetical protein
MVEVETSGGASPTQKVTPRKMNGAEEGLDRCNGDEEKPDADENHARLEKETSKRALPIFRVMDVKRRIPVASVSLLRCGANV